VRMSEIDVNRNQRVYDAPDVVAHYAGLEYLTPCERLLFETHIPPRSTVLDLGVGGGRTTPFLAKRASRYIGIDYAPAMIKACQARFPDLEFLPGNAADLSKFGDGSFQAAVFAFNGIDYVPAAVRNKCFEEIRRVLKAGGVFIFSSHNPRAVLMRARWNRDRLHGVAQNVARKMRLPQSLIYIPMFFFRLVWANVHAFCGTLMRLVRWLPSRMFWKGEGERLDPVHGGLLTHYAVPEKVIAELVSLRFRLVQVLGSDYPERSHLYATGWYYYVFSRPGEK